MTASSMRRAGLYWSFVILMSGLTALFVVLGIWQWNRLAEKEALIAIVASRLDAAPQPLPPLSAWPSFDPSTLEFAPLAATGTYAPEQTIRVFTALGESAKGRYSGPGHWYVTPLRLVAGGTLLVNRGFVPVEGAGAVAEPPAGETTITGIGRASEPVSMFTPAPQPADRIEWVRHVERLAAMLPAEFAPVFPLTLDLPAGPPGALPQGGETVVEFPNNHVGYALTWFGFALLTPMLLGYWMWRERHPQHPD